MDIFVLVASLDLRDCEKDLSSLLTNEIPPANYRHSVAFHTAGEEHKLECEKWISESVDF